MDSRAKHQKYKLCPKKPGKRLRKAMACTSASHPPPGCDIHCRRSAFGGVLKILVSTGSRKFDSSIKLLPLELATL